MSQFVSGYAYNVVRLPQFIQFRYITEYENRGNRLCYIQCVYSLRARRREEKEWRKCSARYSTEQAERSAEFLCNRSCLYPWPQPCQRMRTTTGWRRYRQVLKAKMVQKLLLFGEEVLLCSREIESTYVRIKTSLTEESVGKVRVTNGTWKRILIWPKS